MAGKPKPGARKTKKEGHEGGRKGTLAPACEHGLATWERRGGLYFSPDKAGGRKRVPGIAASTREAVRRVRRCELWWVWSGQPERRRVAPWTQMSSVPASQRRG